MTDQEFLDSDFNALLASMSAAEINERHAQIDAGRSALSDVAEAEFAAWAETRRVPYQSARRNCLECGEQQSALSSRCSDCGEPLLVLSDMFRGRHA